MFISTQPYPRFSALSLQPPSSTPHGKRPEVATQIFGPTEPEIVTVGAFTENIHLMLVFRETSWNASFVETVVFLNLTWKERVKEGRSTFRHHWGIWVSKGQSGESVIECKGFAAWGALLKNERWLLLGRLYLRATRKGDGIHTQSLLSWREA